MVIRILLVLAIFFLHYGMPPRAAKLGSTCCNDIQEHLAKFDIFKAHKNNGSVVLQISGKIPVGIIYWDIYEDQDSYVTFAPHSGQRTICFVADISTKSYRIADYKMNLQIPLVSWRALSDTINNNNLTRLAPIGNMQHFESTQMDDIFFGQ